MWMRLLPQRDHVRSLAHRSNNNELNGTEYPQNNNKLHTSRIEAAMKTARDLVSMA